MNEWIVPAALLLSFVLVNLPWFTQGLFVLIPLKTVKSNGVRFGELLIYILISLGLMIGLELKATGERYAQDWEFYAVTFFIFVLFAFPGFIYRFIYKTR
jgi:hypothetical protein